MPVGETLRDMTPSYSKHNVSDGRMMDAVLGCNGNLGNITLRKPASNRDNISFGELRLAVCIPMALAFFTTAISNVVELCTKSQMRHSHAAWVIADVHNHHVFGNFSMLKFPCEAVSPHGLAVDSQYAITTVLNSASPQPTVPGPINPAPEAITYGRAVVAIDVLDRAAFSPPKALRAVWRNWCELTATAMAIAVWNILRGIIEGHSDLHSRCVKPRDVDASPGQLIAYLHYTPFWRLPLGEVTA